MLAAGQGRRAGGPKALIQVDGQPLWYHQACRLRAAGVPRVIAVLHPSALPGAGALLGHADPQPALSVLSADPDATPLHSLQVALAHLVAVAGALPPPALLLPVDCPAPARPLLLRLQRAALAADAARPLVRVAGAVRGGHPVWLSAALCARLRAVDAGQTRLDLLLHTLGAGYAGVMTRDPRVLGNFNRDGIAH